MVWNGNGFDFACWQQETVKCDKFSTERLLHFKKIKHQTIHSNPFYSQVFSVTAENSCNSISCL
jgi:hypothetical protein